MEKNISNQLAEFVVNTKYEDIPRETLEFTKCMTLKTIAGMLAGGDTPSGKMMSNVIRGQRYNQEYGAVGSGLRTSLWGAIFLGSYLAHARELEDAGFDVQVIWDITVIPLLLPLAEKLKLSGKSLLEALVVGLEVHSRTCQFTSLHLGLMHIPGAVGPAAGAAKALSLGAKETTAALGLAMSGTPLAMASFGTDAHFFESALTSLQGIMAAEMAKEGLAGNADIVAHLSNHLGKERVTSEKIVENLGKEWKLHGIQIKKYPICTVIQRSIDAVIELRQEHNLSYGDVKVIEVHEGPGDAFCDRPEPKDENDLQFSFQHGLGTAMMVGDVGLEHMTKDAVFDPELRKARAKIKFILHPDLPDGILKAPARLVIKMRDGKEFSLERMYALGHPKDPLTVDQFRKLYFKFARGILSEENISKSADMILKLETMSNLKGLIDILI